MKLPRICPCYYNKVYKCNKKKEEMKTPCICLSEGETSYFDCGEFSVWFWYKVSQNVSRDVMVENNK